MREVRVPVDSEDQANLILSNTRFCCQILVSPPSYGHTIKTVRQQALRFRDSSTLASIFLLITGRTPGIVSAPKSFHYTLIVLQCHCALIKSGSQPKSITFLYPALSSAIGFQTIRRDVFVLLPSLPSPVINFCKNNPKITFTSFISSSFLQIGDHLPSNFPLASSVFEHPPVSFPAHHLLQLHSL